MPRPKRPSWLPCHFLIGAVSGWKMLRSCQPSKIGKKPPKKLRATRWRNSMEIFVSSFFVSRIREWQEHLIQETAPKLRFLPLKHGNVCQHPLNIVQKNSIFFWWISKVRGTSFPVHPFIIYKRAYNVSRYSHPKSPRWHPMLARYCAAMPALSTASGHW